MAENNIQNISVNYLCSACGACNAVCSRNAISFRWTSIGRKYAVVDDFNCTSCGSCLKVCPSAEALNLRGRFKDCFIGDILDVYTGKSADETIFHNAQSGGLCTAIVKYLFEAEKIDAAVMCRMSADVTPQVNAVMVECAADLYACQKSCYSPVDVLSALKLTKGKKSVAVIGLPCHIEGATLLQEQFARFSNISYKIGLVCDRTHCKGMLDVLSNRVSAKQKKVYWKKKDFTYAGQYYDYRNAPIVIVDESERICHNGILPNSYRFQLKDMFTAPKCRMCDDKLNIHADLVMGDPWGMTDIDWQHGESLLLVRTKMGRSLVKEMILGGCVDLKRRKNFEEVFVGQQIQERRKSVEAFTNAYLHLISCPDSYIGKKTKTKDVEEQMLSALTDFIKLESQPEPVIFQEARKNLQNVVLQEKNKIIAYLKSKFALCMQRILQLVRNI